MDPNSSSGSQSGGSRATSRSPRVLVVDDEPDLRELIELTLVRMGLDVDSCGSVGDALQRLGENTYALCLTDMRMPDGSGMTLVETIAERYPFTPVAVITAYGSTDNAIAALKAGAFDYLSKPIELDQLRNLVQSALRAFRKEPLAAGERAQFRGVARANEVHRSGLLLDRLLGESPAIREVRSLVQRVSRSQAPVSISGESGSGKELVARAIHDCSGRREAQFVAVNCGAIPENLMEAEFFGYRKGAFTGADSDRDGYFQTARGGTLFLDEVADLPLAMQVKLLRAIQERTVRRVGGMNEEAVDVRLISATHQDLGQCVTQGRFRQDLFYRLNVIDIHIPPLRERREDITLLARHLLQQIDPSLELTPAAQEKLASYQFPGNVRELSNILERSVAFAETDSIDAGNLQLPSGLPNNGSGGGSSVRSSGGASNGMPAETAAERDTGDAPQSVDAGIRNALGLKGTLPEHLDLIEKEIIERALMHTHYNRSATANLLGITFRQLRYRMQRLDIQ